MNEEYTALNLQEFIIQQGSNAVKVIPARVSSDRINSPMVTVTKDRVSFNSNLLNIFDIKKNTIWYCGITIVKGYGILFTFTAENSLQVYKLTQSDRGRSRYVCCKCLIEKHLQDKVGTAIQDIILDVNNKMCLVPFSYDVFKARK
jgi:hypothetical protein